MSAAPYYRQKKRGNQHPWRQDCPTRKITYHSREEALTAAILRPDHEGVNATHPYRCARCGRWHLSKSRRRGRR